MKTTSHSGFLVGILHTDSGFSREGLTSDLLGFYRAILPSNYQSRLQLISKQDALKRWDYYGPIGGYKKQRIFTFIISQSGKAMCSGKPYKGNLPAFMTWIHPLCDLKSGKVKILTNDSTHYSFMSGQ